MITTPILLLLAQTALLPATPLLDTSSKHPSVHSVRHHRHAAATPTPTPEVRITIINATSVPALSLSTIEGGSTHKAYPLFPQGEWTANEAIKTAEVQYLVHSTNGAPISKQSIPFKPHSSQFLLITGDLSTKGPAERLPGIAPAPTSSQPQAWPPNLQYHLFPYTLVSKDPCHYRIFNGMPGKTLLLRSLPVGNKPPQQLALLAPGNSVHLVHQPASVDYVAEIDGQTYRLVIRQEGAAGNCLIPFFLRNGKPDFIRVFETP
jgi:hypothetical protein